MGSADAPSAAQGLKQVLCRALIAAHLITGSLERGEKAVLIGIDRWNPHEEPEERLLLRIVEAAASLHAAPGPNRPILNDSYLSDELRAVLSLEPRHRACFVLRNPVGLPSQVCARLLRLVPNQIAEYNASAARDLALFSPELRMVFRKPEQPSRHS